MRFLRNFFIAFCLTVIFAAVVTIVLTLRKGAVPGEEAAVIDAGVLVPDIHVGWKEDFSDPGSSGIPSGWQVKGKPGTPRSVFYVKKDPDREGSVLFAESSSSSGTLVTQAKEVDLVKTPILTWRWKVNSLPVNADGRFPESDDQAIGIYVGTGTLLSNKSVSYRWDTDTPILTEGKAVYGMGAVKVKWFTLRNIEDTRKNEWFTETRDVLADFQNAWGIRPKKVYVSVSTNSQYTDSTSSAELDWIAFTSRPEK